MTDSSSIVKIVSWNIARRAKCWERLIDMGADVALLQEASEPPAGLADRIDVDPAPWGTAGGDCDPPRAWRTAVVRLSNRVQVEWIEAKSIDAAGSGELAVSCLGTLAAAHVTAPGSDPFVCVSMYSLWTRPHASIGSSWIVSDASAHRIVSDLSALIGRENRHRIVAVGDLNILHGYGDHGNAYWAERYKTVFTRMKGCVATFKKRQESDGSDRPCAVSCSHPDPCNNALTWRPAA